MKKIATISIILLFMVAVMAQVVGPGYVVYTTSAPSGNCSSGSQAQIIIGPGTLYSCQSGTWALIAGGASSAAFNLITGGTNTRAAMVVGSGASLSTTGTGTISSTAPMMQRCSLTASASTVLEFKSANCGSVVFNSTYHTYMIVIGPTTFNTTGGNLMVRFSTNDGTSYDTGANYDWIINANGAVNGFTGETTHRIFCNVVTTATPGCVGNFTLYDPLNSSNKKFMNGHFTSIYTNSTEVDTTESTFYNSTSAVNAMEFAAGTASGTLTGTFTGTISIYGITP